MPLCVTLLATTYPLLLSLLNCCNLLGNNRQHFNVNAVEFIKASPGSSALHTEGGQCHESIEIDFSAN